MEYQDNAHNRYIKQQQLKYLIGRLGICGDYWVKKELTEELMYWQANQHKGKDNEL